MPNDAADEMPSTEPSPPVPSRMRIAGRIWCTVGTLWLLLTFLGLPLVDNALICLGFVILPVGIGVSFVRGGIRAIDGELAGIWLPVCWTFLFGLLHLLWAGGVSFTAILSGDIRLTLFLLTAPFWAAGVALLAAGVLAILSADEYCDWRERYGPNKNRGGSPRGS